jgi:hypothetical protein
MAGSALQGSGLWLPAVAVLAIAGAVLYLDRTPASPSTPPATAPAAVDGVPQGVPAPAESTVPTSRASTPAKTPPAGSPPLLTFPDGSTMPVLNGAKDPVAMPWPPNRPFAPVVEKIVDHGQEWYKHADGVWSTSVTSFDDAAGIERTMGQVWVPGTPKPPRLKLKS